MEISGQCYMVSWGLKVAQTFDFDSQDSLILPDSNQRV